jgi:hypothetical protein
LKPTDTVPPPQPDTTIGAGVAVPADPTGAAELALVRAVGVLVRAALALAMVLVAAATG